MSVNPLDFEAIAAPEAGELLVVVGPTASGKTDLALHLAERFGGEIIGADSVQIYRGFDLGSGKPTTEERRRAPHHLVDCADPGEPFDAQRFAEIAEQLIAEIRTRGRVPIVCGGTFLWVRALVRGLAPAPPADAAIRAEHAAFVAAQGRAALHDRLAEVDPESAARLAPNDALRVSRALEVHAISGRTQSAWHADHGFRTERHKARLLGVARERDDLDRRIERRVHAWLEQGWIDEVRDLVHLGHAAARAMGSVGYRQIQEHLRGDIAAADLEVAIVRATRIFVRRQRTWLRDEPMLWTTPPAD